MKLSFKRQTIFKFSFDNVESFMSVKYDVGSMDGECLQSWFRCLSYCIWRLGWL